MKKKLLCGLAIFIVICSFSPVAQAKRVHGGDNAFRCPQYEALLKKHHLPVKDFSRIMYRESRCQTKAIGWNYHKGSSYKDCRLDIAKKYKTCKAVRSYDSGLLQINSSWKSVVAQVCHSKKGDLTVLLTPDCNLAVAGFLYHDGGGIGNWKATA